MILFSTMEIGKCLNSLAVWWMNLIGNNSMQLSLVFFQSNIFAFLFLKRRHSIFLDLKFIFITQKKLLASATQNLTHFVHMCKKKNYVFIKISTSAYLRSVTCLTSRCFVFMVAWGYIKTTEIEPSITLQTTDRLRFSREPKRHGRRPASERRQCFAASVDELKTHPTLFSTSAYKSRHLLARASCSAERP